MLAPMRRSPSSPPASGDELRVEISRLSTAATERLVIEQLDEATQQALVENFIAKVGAS